MKLAFVYDRLNKIGGAEYVLQELAALYPEADWYTSVWDPAEAPFSRFWRVHPSFLNRVSFLRTRHEWVPYLMPFAFESFDFSGYDIVVSVTSAEAKGIITRPGTLHLCYCLTPTRYLYSDRSTYLHDPLSRYVAGLLQKWDQVASTRPDEMIAISEHVKKRIKKYYNRDSVVIYPPVDTKKFSQTATLQHCNTGLLTKNNYFLSVSRLVPSKRVDLLVDAFNQSGDRLVIVGTGVEAARLRRQAKSNIFFAGRVSDEALVAYYQYCQAYVTAAEEDFGISIAEAQAAGKPVLSFAGGGASEIVRHGQTGILVNYQSAEGIVSGLAELKSKQNLFTSQACRQNAARFDKVVWREKMQQRIENVWKSL